MLIDKGLYHQIKALMPIPCVDLVVINDKNEILMLKRSNDPAKGEWWFPGGRVHFGEKREDAVFRKLQQECGLSTIKIHEIGTDDLVLKNSDGTISHAITTVFLVKACGEVILDSQSFESKWDTPSEWLKSINNDFLSKYIRRKA